MDIRKPRATPTPTPATGSGRTVTKPFDGAAYLTTEARMAALLDAALEDGHPQVIAAALGDLAKARGMTRIAKETGLNREALYRALSSQGNPELETFMKVIKALGFTLHATATA